MKARLLLIEDEEAIAAPLLFNLEQAGYEVQHVRSGVQGLRIGQTDGFDLILLDVMLPEMDGFEVCRQLRTSEILTPILMLTALGEASNRVKGLENGADDYLPKPFDLSELLARVHALLRRRNWKAKEEAPEVEFEIAGVRFDFQNLELKGKSSVELTAVEAKLLRFLMSERGRIKNRSEILKKVWGFSDGVQTRTLDNFVMRLRNHLQTVGGSPDWIEAIRGVGYRFLDNLPKK